MSKAPKSLPQFFIDNQGQWPNGTKLAGDLVIWPDSGRYPGLVPIAIAKAADFDGRVVVQAGNRCLLMSFLPGASNMAEIQAGLKNKEVEQYRIAVDSLVQRMLVWRAEKGDRPDTDVSPIALLNWLGRSSPVEAACIAKALAAVKDDPLAADLLHAIQKGLEKSQETEKP